MRKITRIILSLYLFSAFNYAQAESSGHVKLRDMQVAAYTSQGSANIEHCVFTDTLTINGRADINHTKFKFGVVHGELTAHGVDAHSLTINGSARISGKSDIAELHTAGFANIEDSYIDFSTINGSVRGKGAYIKKITVNNGDLEFIDSDLGKVYVNNTGTKRGVITIKLLGKTTVRHLTVESKTTPTAIIILDDESKKGFNKSKVISNGKIEYK